MMVDSPANTASKEPKVQGASLEEGHGLLNNIPSIFHEFSMGNFAYGQSGNLTNKSLKSIY